MKTKNGLMKKIEKNKEELEKGIIDLICFGTNIIGFKEDGSIVRIDPYSEEGRRAILKMKKGKKDER